MDVRYGVQVTLALIPILAAVVRDGYALTKRFSEYLPMIPRPEAGQPVLLIPGLFANDATLMPLAAALRRLGYRAETWGCGMNKAQHQLMMQIIVQKVRTLHHATGMPVVIIGHSLGGLYAVCAAHTCGAKRVRSVITIGSPVNLNPAAVSERTREGLLRVSGKSLEAHLAAAGLLLEKVSTLPRDIPVTTIAAQRDTVVGVDSCGYRDVAPGNRHTALIVSEPAHHGMPFHPLTLAAVADRARYGVDDWERFDVKRYSVKRPIDHLISVSTTP